MATAETAVPVPSDAPREAPGEKGLKTGGLGLVSSAVIGVAARPAARRPAAIRGTILASVALKLIQRSTRPLLLVPRAP